MKHLLIAALAAVTSLAASAFAEYPEKPITIVVPFAAGGPTDKVARDLAEALRKPLGGAHHHHRERRRRRRHARRHQGGHAPRNDGYTLLLHHIGMATSPALYRTMQYKTLEDFEYLGMINEVPMTLIGKPGAAGQQLRRTGEVDRRQQGQDQPRQRRPGRRLAPVRAAVPDAR